MLNENYALNSFKLLDPVLMDTGLHKHQQNLINIIEKNPGIRYRELLRSTNLSNGVLTYHLTELAGSNIINVERRRGVTRYYSVQISSEESRVISHIRNVISRKILLLIIERGSCTLSEIAVLTNKAPSTISWYLQRLLDANIIKKKSTSSDGVYYKSRFYEVVNKILVLDMLSKYVESPFEKVVSNYSEIVEEL
ncbi:MAG: winged helix-turn-helix transcriptional regulator [Candidatus Eiseniibacteriota bacterium]